MLHACSLLTNCCGTEASGNNGSGSGNDGKGSEYDDCGSGDEGIDD